MAIVILDMGALVGDLQAVWPLAAKHQITPVELVSIAVASWIEFHNRHGVREIRDIMIMNIEDHFGEIDDGMWYRLTESTYLMVDSYISSVCNMANVDDVAYAGHVPDGIMIRLYGQGVLREHQTQKPHSPHRISP